MIEPDFHFRFKGKFQDVPGPFVEAQNVRSVMGGYMHEHPDFAPFRMGRFTDKGSVVDVGPPRSLHESLEMFPKRCLSEAKIGRKFRILSTRNDWFLGIHCLEEKAGDRAIDIAKTQLGRRYVFGAADPVHGFDCSGLVLWAWNGVTGIDLPHSAAMMWNDPRIRHVSHDQAKEGDLVFQKYPSRPVFPSHVGLKTEEPHQMLDTRSASEPVAFRYLDPQFTVGYGRLDAND